MILELKIPESLDRLLPTQVRIDLHSFLQAFLNRALVGQMRYGDPRAKKQYATRKELEAAEYWNGGNFENLLNEAVYCWLESQAPENKRFHFDPTAASATRERLGGHIA